MRSHTNLNISSQLINLIYEPVKRSPQEDAVNRISRIVDDWYKRNFEPYWKTWAVVLTPIVLLPLCVLVNTPESKTGYVILLMSIYWFSSALPLAVTSLLPIILLPLMGVMGTNEVCAQYFKGSNVVFFCGVALALGVEQSNLHRRVALRSLLLVGTDPKWLMLTLMMIGCLLSMWITNSAVTAMLLPIVQSIINEIFENDSFEGVELKEVSSRPTIKDKSSEIPLIVVTKPENQNESVKEISQYRKKVHIAMNISIGYSASIGGAATLIGSGAPLLLKGIIEGMYPNENALSLPAFMSVAVPIAIINIFLTWAWLCVIYVGFRSSKHEKQMKDSSLVKKVLKKQLEELGPMTFHQAILATLFAVLILLWFFRDPGFVSGWISLFPNNVEIGDATVGVVILVLAFILPAQPKFWCLENDEEQQQNTSSKAKRSPSVLDWSYTQKNFQWNVLLLLGGGYALSEATKVSHLDDWMGNQLIGLNTLPPFVIMILACLITSSVTEVSSNTATAAIFLPVLAKLAETSEGNPLYLMIPSTICCCYAFCLPAGAPCNAMVLSSAKIKTSYMVKAGMMMKIFTLLTTCFITASIGDLVFYWDVYPNWISTAALSNSTTTHAVFHPEYVKTGGPLWNAVFNISPV